MADVDGAQLPRLGLLRELEALSRREGWPPLVARRTRRTQGRPYSATVVTPAAVSR